MKLLKILTAKNWLLWIILIAALFLRTYRAADLTGFYFDQGRDAKVIWDLWHSHKFFLIGPTTGIEGIFLGPFYYYLIAPFYLIGNGNPVMVSDFLALLNVAGIYLIYLTGKKFFSRETGLLATFFITFSLQLTQAHRWLSNPTPLPFFTALVIYCLLNLVHGSKSVWSWLGLGLSIGLGLQCEAASAVFFIPASIIVLAVFCRSVRWNWKVLTLVGIFLLTLVPQLYFNYRHDNILVNSFKKFLVADKSFTPVLSSFYSQRLFFYFDTFSQKIMLDRSWAFIFFVIVAALMIIGFTKIPKKPFFTLLIIWITPLVLLLFYHGNNGYVWDYYFTGVYSIFVLSLAVVLVSAFKIHKLAQITVAFLASIFLATNLFHLHNYLSAGTDGPTDVVLGSELNAVDWVYENVGNTPFNVDVYVPPVIPHAYDYLFLWRGTTKYHKLPDSNLQPLLYTLYEVDTPHPERLAAWMKRQAGIAVPEAQVSFGGVTVQKRIRLPQ
jgi:4-amino-4-deoxy-L-arabinose transferase-like glycosyltransferase